MTDTYLPRLFWRRFAAFIVDFLCIEVAVIILALLVQPLVTTHISVPKPLVIGACTQVEKLSAGAFILPLLNIEEGDQLRVSICTASFVGLLEDRTMNFHIQRRTGNRTFYRTLRVPVDEALRPVAQIDLNPLLMLFAPLLFALCLLRFGTTPGKKLMRLKLRHDGGGKPSLTQLAKREYLRLSLGVFIGIVSIAFGAVFVDPENLEKMVLLVNDASKMLALLVLTGAVSVVFFVIFSVSFLRWRGRMIYDRLAGFEVVFDDPHKVEVTDGK